MVYKHAIVAAFHIYAQRGEDVAKPEVGGYALNSHGNYIVDCGIVVRISVGTLLLTSGCLSHIPF